MDRVEIVQLDGALTKELDQATIDQATIDRARQLAGLKGDVTNLDPAVVDGAAVTAGCHDMWQVEASFRVTKHDLQARARVPSPA